LVVGNKGFTINTRRFGDASENMVYPHRDPGRVLMPGPLMFDHIRCENPANALCACGCDGCKKRCASVRVLSNASSEHADGLNVVFCDGHARFVSEEMDVQVFALAVSSDGVRWGQASQPYMDE
jgi:prepilin-type processing-associated H-X9-DG protein